MSLLKGIGLSDSFSFELNIGRSDFVDTLRANIDRPQSDFFDIFSRSKNLYKGTVTYDGFELKPKRRFFDMNINLARSKGRLTQAGDKLIVDIEINGFSYFMVPFIILLLLIYSFAIGAIVVDGMGNMDGWGLLFLLVHAVFMIGIPYLMLRRSMRLVKYNLERDIYFIMKDKLNVQR